MKKEIIGYKLSKPEYRNAALSMIPKSHHLQGKTSSFMKLSNTTNILREAGVLDLWFEPVYKEPEFKVGDIVVITQDRGGDPEGTTTIIKEKTFDSFYVKAITKYHISGNFRQSPETFRHATPEEIEKYNKPKLPVINGYKGEFIPEQGLITYGCAKLPVEWFNGSVNRYIKSLTLNSGIEINKEQTLQIKTFLKLKNNEKINNNNCTTSNNCNSCCTKNI